MVNVSDIIAYEGGQMTEQEEIRFFQELVNTGQAWSLQGSYGRRASQLLKAGVIIEPNI